MDSNGTLMDSNGIHSDVTVNGSPVGGKSAAAINIACGVYRSELSKEEMVDYYDQWSSKDGGKDYDSLATREAYTGPDETARRITDFFPPRERSKVRVLDVAAGTGRIGEALHKDGFKIIEALDPSEGMLQKARAKKVYSNFIQDFIGVDNKVPVDNGHYDALGCCGGFGEAHIPASAMIEMIRIVRPGGLICIGVREEYLDFVPEYEQTMGRLEDEGAWRMASKETYPGFYHAKSGCIFQFLVL